MGLTRLRLGVLAATFVVLGTSAGGIFDRFVWILAIVPLLPIGLVTLTVARAWGGAAHLRRHRRHPRRDSGRGLCRGRGRQRHRHGVHVGRATAALDGVAEPVPPTAGRRRGGRAGHRCEPERDRRVRAALEPAAARAGGAHVPRRDRPVGAARDPAVDTHHRLHPLGDVRRAPRRGAGAARSVALPPRRAAALRARRPRRADRRLGECARVVRRPGRSAPGRAADRHRSAARSDPGDRRPAVARSATADARSDPHRRLDGRRRADADAVANGRARRVRRSSLESHAHDPPDRPHAGHGDRADHRCRRQLPARLPDARTAAREPGVGGRRRRDRSGSHDRPARRAPCTGRRGGDRVERRPRLDEHRRRGRGRARSRRERRRLSRASPSRSPHRATTPCSANSEPSKRRW